MPSCMPLVDGVVQERRSREKPLVKLETDNDSFFNLSILGGVIASSWILTVVLPLLSLSSLMKEGRSYTT